MQVKVSLFLFFVCFCCCCGGGGGGGGGGGLFACLFVLILFCFCFLFFLFLSLGKTGSLEKWDLTELERQNAYFFASVIEAHEHTQSLEETTECVCVRACVRACVRVCVRARFCCFVVFWGRVVVDLRFHLRQLMISTQILLGLKDRCC